tara:strand:+ start:526 stop:996 length:471 start_codon:yes stop_codon:yes gene_type:complete
MRNDFKIIPFERKLINFFIDLNLEWLNEFFEVEPYDSKILNQSENVIINKGGYIFFGKQNGRIIGTFALIKRGEESFELAKMAVKKYQRNNGYGNKMIQFAISFGIKNNWREIFLYSNTKLKNSIHLYSKYGFRKVEIEKKSPYLRGNIKMKLLLQ